MPRTYKNVYRAKAEEYLALLQQRGRAPGTIELYGSHLRTFEGALKAHNLPTAPSKIGAEELENFIENRRQNVALSTLQTQVTIIRSFLEFCDNHSFKDIGFRITKPPRPNAHWLAEPEAIQVIQACQNPEEDLIIHLALEMGLRGIGIRNLRHPEDFQSGFLNVLGKGGKWRTLPYHQYTPELLRNYLPLRERTIAHRPNQEIPPNLLLCFNNAWGVTPMSKKTLRTRVRSVGNRAGIDNLVPHTLRRTFGRLTYFNLMSQHPPPRIPPLITVSKILGHSNVSTTVEYLGIDLEDMSEAYRQGSTLRRGVKTAISHPESGEPVHPVT